MHGNVHTWNILGNSKFNSRCFFCRLRPLVSWVLTQCLVTFSALQLWLIRWMEPRLLGGRKGISFDTINNLGFFVVHVIRSRSCGIIDLESVFTCLFFPRRLNVPTIILVIICILPPPNNSSGTIPHSHFQEVFNIYLDRQSSCGDGWFHPHAKFIS